MGVLKQTRTEKGSSLSVIQYGKGHGETVQQSYAHFQSSITF